MTLCIEFLHWVGPCIEVQLILHLALSRRTYLRSQHDTVVPVTTSISHWPLTKKLVWPVSLPEYGEEFGGWESRSSLWILFVVFVNEVLLAHNMPSLCTYSKMAFSYYGTVQCNGCDRDHKAYEAHNISFYKRCWLISDLRSPHNMFLPALLACLLAHLLPHGFQPSMHSVFPWACPLVASLPGRLWPAFYKAALLITPVLPPSPWHHTGFHLPHLSNSSTYLIPSNVCLLL